MSNIYIDQTDAAQDRRVEVNRSKTVDIESELSQRILNLTNSKTDHLKKISYGHAKTRSTGISAENARYQEPLQKFKPAKIVTLQ
jgi:hypothetical protein